MKTFNYNKAQREAARAYRIGMKTKSLDRYCGMRDEEGYRLALEAGTKCLRNYKASMDAGDEKAAADWWRGVRTALVFMRNSKWGV